MYTKAAVLATNATSLPMWDPEGYRMVPLPNMVANFRDNSRSNSWPATRPKYSPSVMTIFICDAILVCGSLLYVIWAVLVLWRVSLRRDPRQVIKSNESFFHSDLV